jgi:hypothetical protein
VAAISRAADFSDCDQSDENASPATAGAATATANAIVSAMPKNFDMAGF